MPEPWDKAETLYRAALEREPDERDVFLEKACAGDEALLDEVRSRLVNTWVGRRVQSYEVLSLIGAGGMGEVYRAKDTKLGREVALKVLSREFADDAERVTRFEREARLLAALNHPNIAAIHGLEESEGRHVLVLELVEGETLAERIARGPIPVSEALPLFRQLAAGLEAAHEKGIVHRDLKPSNVTVTPEAQVKVLDFGLAKASRGVVAAGSDVRTETAWDSQTAEGRIVGTVSYMSPEQARGQAVDKRADVWAFGCVLYEALTGRRAFAGGTVTDTLAAVLDREVDWERLPSATPATLRSLLRRCLQKDRDRRLHDIADARIEIEEALAGHEEAELPAAPATGRRPARRRAVSGTVGVLLVAATAIAMAVLWPRPPSAPVMRFAVGLPPEHQLNLWQAVPIALSPDGRRFVYAAEHTGGSSLFLRELDQLEAEPLPGTGAAHNPFFSPDGEWVGFFTEAGTLEKVSVAGGSPVTICDTQGLDAYIGASWGPYDTIVFSDSSGLGELWRVSAGGGTPERLGTGSWPQILPDGKHVLYSSLVEGSASEYRPALLSLETGESQTLHRGQARARYVSSGHLVYGQSGSLMAIRFDSSSLELRGSPRPVLDGVSVHPAGPYRFAVSHTGSLAYVPGGEESTLERVDREGRVAPLFEESGWLMRPRVSPDGQHVAFAMSTEGRPSGIWVYDVERGTQNLLRDEGPVWAPVWTPDGERVTFAGSDGRSLYWRPADGSGDAQLLRRDIVPTRGHFHPAAWSPDGQYLAITKSDDGRNHDIWVVPLDGESLPMVATEREEGAPAFSPDGRWLAYVSNESGRYEVYVRTFPGGGGKWMISTNGGLGPTWSPDGREVYFRDASGRTMMAASFVSEPTVRVGTPKRLFEGDYRRDGRTNRQYDISPDGQGFLMIKKPQMSSINIVVNWSEELERLVPTD